MQHLTVRQCARAYSRIHPLPRILFRSRRSHSHLPSNPPSGNNIPDVEQVHSIHDHNFAGPTLISLDYFRRALKYSLVGFVTLAATTCTVFEAAHLWIEHVELAPDRDQDNVKWGWTQEAERWSGGASTGGTDPALGFKARHAVRGAWIAQHWGTGSTITRSSAIEGAKPAGVSAISAGLELAHDFLNIALTIALARQHQQQAANSDSDRRLRAQTVPELLARHANILERMGSRAFLFDARTEYERVWAASGGKGVDAARTAAKLGDICSRLSDREEAVEWWLRASALVTPQSSSLATFLPESMPESALAQRTLASVVPSMSAHFVQTGDLKQARQLEEAGLNLLSKYTSSPKASSSSSAESLHELYLAHRASLLSIHLAEVTFALKEDPANSLERLKYAALSSERIANILTGSPLTHPDATSIPPPPSSDKALQAGYASSRTLRSPASSLLRDARRSAVEAWTLAGILSEQQQQKRTSAEALECYERALAWAGVGAADSMNGIGQPGEGTLEKDWHALWQRYIRVRDIVRTQQQQQRRTKA